MISSPSMGGTTQSSELIRPLAGFRAIASLWVVVVHTESLHPGNIPESAQMFLRGYGTLPVVFFFVLSGFILSLVYSERIGESGFQPNELKTYAWARIARVVPLYFFTLIVPIGFHLAWTNRGGTVPMPFTEHTVIGSLGFSTDGWAFNSLFRSNVPAWTLTAELIFYSLFPFVFPRIARQDRTTLFRGIGFSLGIYGFIQLVLGIVQIYGDDWWGPVGYGLGHFGSPLFVPVFLVGIYMGILVRKGGLLNWAETHADAVYAAFVIGVVLLVTLPTPPLPPSVVTAMLCPLICLSIVAGHGQMGLTNRVLSWPVVQLFGSASYAIYITHWPVKELLQFYFHPEGWPELAKGFFVLGVVIAVGFICHFWVEKPLYRWVRLKSAVG